MKRFESEGAPAGDSAQDILSLALPTTRRKLEARRRTSTKFGRTRPAYEEKKTEEISGKLDALNRQERDIDQKYYQLQGQYSGKAKQEIADAPCWFGRLVSNVAPERRQAPFRLNELSEGVRNSAALDGVPKDAEARLVDGQMKFETTSGYPVTVKASENQVRAHSDRRIDRLEGGRLPGDVVTSTLKQDGTLTDKTEDLSTYLRARKNGVHQNGTCANHLTRWRTRENNPKSQAPHRRQANSARIHSRNIFGQERELVEK